MTLYTSTPRKGIATFVATNSADILSVLKYYEMREEEKKKDLGMDKKDILVAKHLDDLAKKEGVSWGPGATERPTLNLVDKIEKVDNLEIKFVEESEFYLRSGMVIRKEIGKQGMKVVVDPYGFDFITNIAAESDLRVQQRERGTNIGKLLLYEVPYNGKEPKRNWFLPGVFASDIKKHNWERYRSQMESWKKTVGR